MNDYEAQQADMEQRQQEALQALMNVAAAGLTNEAETLAMESGLTDLWHQQITITERRAA